ncbi:MAG: DUF5060 domain-containing protein [Bacteroidota bacterium]
MTHPNKFSGLLFLLLCSLTHLVAQSPEGELRRWHRVSLTFEGPTTNETATPNPFTDYSLEVSFTHSGTNATYTVPGYYAACGDAAENSCDSGDKWRVHFSPDRTGTWTWQASFKQGNDIAVNGGGGSAGYFDGASGNFSIQESNKNGRDHRAPQKGRLKYVGTHYLRFVGTDPVEPNGDWFIKAGADAPENMLSYDDFDGVPDPQKTWAPHQQDYHAADAQAYTWQGGKGSEMLGAIRYLGEIKQVNAFSFLTFSLDGDDKTISPHLTSSGNGKGWNQVHHDRFDVSRLAQWEKIFSYADKKGMFLHFKTQETENDQKMDGGGVGRERKLYYRELIARFGHHLALNWNMGEENTQTEAQRKAMAQYFADTDPYQHLVVLHTYPNQQDQVYNPLLGNSSAYTGISVQTNIGKVHADVVRWVEKSATAGKAWVVANDEQGNANVGVDADPEDREKVREEVIWGTLLGGGAGFEYYYGYGTGCTDLTCQDHRSRDEKYTDAAYALDFFETYFMSYLPEVVNADNEISDNDAYVLRTTDKKAYALYLPEGGSPTLSGLPSGTHSLRWFNPRNGQMGSAAAFSGGQLTAPDNQDWVALLETSGGTPPPPPPPTPDYIQEEIGGVLAIEAEHFVGQSETGTRQWYLTTTSSDPGITPDPDPNHASGASESGYLEILPDTRVTHSDQLINGTNFTNTPGLIAILEYQVYIHNPGRYYVWVRAYSTGTEDNGVHVGLDGNWPASGERMQWCNGKNNWTWESKQRTTANHCGEPEQIYLDINTPGLHTIHFSMREDGFEMDKMVLSQAYTAPNGTGPAEVLYDPTPFPVEWLSFTAEAAGPHQVDLHWTTATEQNNVGFEIERSEDEITFEKIGEVPGLGNSSVPQTYQFQDEDPSANVLYYRLKQMDIDGVGHYSEVREVHLAETFSASLTLYPNPVKRELTVSIEAQPDQVYGLYILDMQGRTVYQGIYATGDAMPVIDVAAWSDGLYMFLMRDQQTQQWQSSSFMKD